jgi:death-on-curing protein
MVKYLSTDDVIDLSIIGVRATGDVPQGLRDRGLLESAVMRPQFLAHYGDADLFEQASALACGISRSQAFVDGNKRAALQAVSVFLRLNGYRLPSDRMAFARILLEVAAPEIDAVQGEATLADWLRSHTEPA